MYSFTKLQDNDSEWRLELNGISLLCDGFFLKNDMHWLKNPQKAIGYFRTNGNIFGVANDIIVYNTAEEFYDSILKQYNVFKTKVNYIGNTQSEIDTPNNYAL